MQTLWEYKGQRGMHAVLLDRELPALYVPLSISEPKPENRVGCLRQSAACRPLYHGK